MKKLNKKGKNVQKKILIILILFICLVSVSMTTQAAKNKFVKKSGRTYYYNSKGKKTKGLKKIKGNYYYFDKKGVLYKKGWKTVKGGTYYFAKNNGAALIGIKKLSNKRYYFANNGKLSGTGIKKHGGKYYYVKKGVVQTGYQKVSGKVYFFFTSGNARVNQWYTYKSESYYLTADGSAKTGWLTLKGKEYYFASTGILQRNKWIGDKYLGSGGYVTKTKSDTTPTPDPPAPQPMTREQHLSKMTYHPDVSQRIFDDINKFRVENGKPALKKGVNRDLKLSAIQAGYNLYQYVANSADYTVLAGHGGGQIGTGLTSDSSLYSSDSYYPMSSANPKSWINSPLHKGNILTTLNDTCAVVVIDYSNGGVRATSVIVTFSRNNSDSLPIYSGVGEYGTKEYVSKTELSSVPYAEWEEYLKIAGLTE